MIKIINVGKIKRRSLTNEIDFYLNRIRNYTKIERISIPESKHKEENKVSIDETERLLDNIKNRDYSICLDNKGKQLDSVQFAKKIDKIITHSKVPTFIIGGAFGISEKLLTKFDFVLSFSNLTYQHDIALIVLVEQIYRSLTIIKNHPYHK